MENILFSVAVEQYIKILERKYKYNNISKIELITKTSILKDKILPYFKDYNLKNVTESEIDIFFIHDNIIEMQQIKKLIKEIKKNIPK